MPMYEYRCEGCGTTFERLRKFSDPPVEVHDGCGGKVERLITAAGLHFKGSGWYINDYARAGQKDGKNGGEAKKQSDTPAKTESSPAPAAPAKKD
jgi:putative FmdB family regulatory protein